MPDLAENQQKNRAELLRWQRNQYDGGSWHEICVKFHLSGGMEVGVRCDV